MRLSVLPLLACPGSEADTPCGGPLGPGDGASGLPTRLAPDDPDELLDGELVCADCRTAYPVLSGAAILTPRPIDYLRRHAEAVRRDLARYGFLSHEAQRWLDRRLAASRGSEDYGADFRFSQQFEEPWEIACALASEPDALYGGFAAWLRSVRGQGPYDLLARWARERCQNRGLALDIGSGGGGLVARLAPHFAAVFGADLSLLAVLLARRVLLHRPSPERSYLLTLRPGREVERPLRVAPTGNAEFVVADCRALPFRAGLFDTVCSSNVADLVGIDAAVDAAVRAMRPEGLFLLANPFYFRREAAPAEEPREALRRTLERRGLRVEVEQDGVPWLWATYDRHWRIYFVYCMAARRALAAG